MIKVRSKPSLRSLFTFHLKPVEIQIEMREISIRPETHPFIPRSNQLAGGVGWGRNIEYFQLVTIVVSSPGPGPGGHNDNFSDLSCWPQLPGTRQDHTTPGRHPPLSTTTRVLKIK